MNADWKTNAERAKVRKREFLSFDKLSAVDRGEARIEGQAAPYVATMACGEAMNRATQNETDARYYRDLLSPETRARLEERERARTEE